MATASKVKKIVKKAAPAKVVRKPAVKAKISSKKPAPKPVKRVVKKTATRRAAKPEVAAIKPCKTNFTATDAISKAAAATELEPKQIKAVLAWYQRYIAACLMKGGIGSVKLLGFNFKSKFKAPVKVPAIKKGTMIANPFAGGELQAHKGRPASVRPAKMVLKAMPMKAMKDQTAI